MEQPQRVSEVIGGVIARLQGKGVPIRSRKERIEAIMIMIRKEFPAAMEQDLRGSWADFSLAERQDESCNYDKSRGRCPRSCGTGGKLWYVDLLETRDGPRYVVRSCECGIKRRWREDDVAKKAARKEPANAVTFSAR